MTETPKRLRRLATITALTGLAATGAYPAHANEEAPVTVMMPTGGGYEFDTLQAFAKMAISRAGDKTVDLVVVPSAYGDDWPSRPENIALARQRTQEIEDACTAVVVPGKRCVGRLAILLNRADALKPANSAALRSPSLDGIYALGGDQGIAMKVLANSPAETAMTAAVKRGVPFAGTSAGAAIESTSMINGYVGDYGAAQGLRRGSTLVWWGNDADRQRGLAFGSERAIYDQHFYERGRSVTTGWGSSRPLPLRSLPAWPRGLAGPAWCQRNRATGSPTPPGQRAGRSGTPSSR